MAHSSRPITSGLRHSSLGQAGNSSNPSPALLARLNEKRLELESYRELRDLSAQLAEQMQSLQEKLATVAGGAQAVAIVLSNWQDILNAIKMASMKIPKPTEIGDADPYVDLPQTLIRIPTQQQSISKD